MPPRKKAKADAPVRKVGDFLELVDELVKHCRIAGDAGRAKSFETALLKLNDLRSSDDDTPLTESDADEFLKVKGVGKTTVELMKEFIKTGTMERLENLRKVQKLPIEGSEGEPDENMVEAKLIEKFWETARTDLRAAIATLPEKYTLSVEGHFGRNAVIIGGVENRVLFEVEGKEYSFVWTEENYDYNGLFPFEIHGEWHSTTGKVKGTFTYRCEDLADGCFNYTSLAIEPEEFDKENNPKFYQGLLDECENIEGDYDFFTPE